ncbi:hypothetical protein [Moorena sp. SIO4A5]|uniref:hypothetical protein n=1 Tax=Moorena sp. SIO4A5 TaxID=2607838 RepID=UPI0025CFF267|nr:hypothetical protein [Moorena sp. SIO4A5]
MWGVWGVWGVWGDGEMGRWGERRSSFQEFGIVKDSFAHCYRNYCYVDNNDITRFPILTSNF